VYPFNDGRPNFLHALRMARVSACALGSFSLATAFRPRYRVSPVLLFTIAAPNGTGDGVLKLRAVNCARAVIIASSLFRCASKTRSIFVAKLVPLYRQDLCVRAIRN
jgi:hypothetical protein